MTVLITGGAGYIGSHMVLALQDRNEPVVVLDDLSTGQRHLVGEKATFVEGSAGDSALVKQLISSNGIDTVVHFAGSIVVPESVENPLAYYANNTMNSRNLMEAAIASGAKNFIFSSTATVYAGQSADPLHEDMAAAPISPYGRSKLMTEWMLEDASKAHPLRHVVLRYFNVAGADHAGRSGQSNPRATHLIKRASQVALGRVPRLDIFGTDYPTPDGTGVRDYIHVSDLVHAHVLALDYLRNGGESTVMNCGYGHGSSVREVIAAVERVTGRSLSVNEGPRRAGDPPWLVSDARKVVEILGWKPQYDDLDGIVRSAYEWEKRLNSSG